ncbi:unnamed protein product [Closterium sp. NIES-53]
MELRPSSVPQRVVLPETPASSLPHVPDPESELARAASPTVTRLLATVVTDPDLESTAAFALVTELVDFAARSRLDYIASLVTESESVCPPFVEGEPALSSDVLKDRQFELECLAAALPRFASMMLCPEGDPDALDIPTPRSYAQAIAGEYSSKWQTAMDADMASWKSRGTYFDEVPPPRPNIVDGMWIFRGVDFFQTFSPTPKMTNLRVLLHVAAQRDYELHSLDFSTAFLQGDLHEEIWLRRPPGFTGSFPAALGFAPSSADPSLLLRTDTTLPPFYVLVYVDNLVFATADTEALALVKAELQERHTCTDLGELRSYLGLEITRDRARRTITLIQSHMVHQVLRRLRFQFSSPQPTPLSTGHSLSAPPSDESVEPSGPYPELVGCLMYLMTCTRLNLAYPLNLLARYVAPGRHRKMHWDVAKRVERSLCSISGMGLVLGGQGSVVLTEHSEASWADDQATQRSSQGYTFNLGSGSVSWRSTPSSMLGSSCEAEIYAGAMAAQELRWLTYLLTDLGERPRSPPVLYVDNKAMLALCREQRLEHGTKHIALHYFLARELQQCRQLRLSYVASRANIADVFTSALGSGDISDRFFKGPPHSVAPLVASPCPACRVALPCQSRRPTARASPCWQPRRPAMSARRPALPALNRPAAHTALLRAALLLPALLPARRPVGSRTAARTTLPAPPCCCPPCSEEEGKGKRRIQAPNRLTYDAPGKPAKSDMAGAALMVGDDEESDYKECAFAFFSPMEMPGESATLKEALESSDAEEWKKAMESELKSIEENGTWELVELPEGRKAIMSKWLFKIKSDADGKIERYKSRLVAKGYQQKEKVDFKELFAPVVKSTTLRTLLAGAAIKGWVVKQMDVTTVFLNGILEEKNSWLSQRGLMMVVAECGS